MLKVTYTYKHYLISSYFLFILYGNISYSMLFFTFEVVYFACLWINLIPCVAVAVLLIELHPDANFFWPFLVKVTNYLPCLIIVEEALMTVPLTKATFKPTFKATIRVGFICQCIEDCLEDCWRHIAIGEIEFVLHV